MAVARVLPLFDVKHAPPSWNERMQPGEYAVLFAYDQPSEVEGRAAPDEAFCVVTEGLEDAEAYARHAVEQQPGMLCKIYDHRGMVGAPLREIAGSAVKTGEISGRIRRWLGGSLVAVGIVLGVVEWWSGFKLNWPGILGSRIGPAGAILLLTEAGISLEAARKRRRQGR